MSKPTLLFIFGTRPEAIKLAPLIMEFKRRGNVNVKVCVTAQHRQMLDQVLDFFRITPDFDLDLMKENQDLYDVAAASLKGLKSVLEEVKPFIVFVQGDTTTSFTGALAAYYQKIKVAHIEAGLRSGNKYSPFPEEMNRVLAGHLSDFHFTPTILPVKNLQKENIHKNVYNVGNTVIDALFLGLELIQQEGSDPGKEIFSEINFNNRIVLITGHRRESFGIPFEQICKAISDLARSYPEVEFVYPVHLNPNVQDPVNRILNGHKNIHLIKPLDYPDFIWLMQKSYLVLTDSGGMQEEAPSLGKPVLVMRDVTERQEGIEAGTAKLVGTDYNIIKNEVSSLLNDVDAYQRMARSVNPYGDGTASIKIVDIITDILEREKAIPA